MVRLTTANGITEFEDYGTTVALLKNRQMQSGMDYQPVVRIYNSVKQLPEDDPEGFFIRERVPELARCLAPAIREPRRMLLVAQQRTGVIIGQHYPAPVVEVGATGKAARRPVPLSAWRGRKYAEIRVLIPPHTSQFRHSLLPIFSSRPSWPQWASTSRARRKSPPTGAF